MPLSNRFPVSALRTSPTASKTSFSSPITLTPSAPPVTAKSRNSSNRPLAISKTSAIAPIKSLLVASVLKNSVHWFLSLFCAPARVSILSRVSNPYMFFNSSATFGRTSRETTCPFFSISSNSDSVIPMAFANIFIAPGSLSPNCPLNSSAWIFPLDTICSKAV